MHREVNIYQDMDGMYIQWCDGGKGLLSVDEVTDNEKYNIKTYEESATVKDYLVVITSETWVYIPALESIKDLKDLHRTQCMDSGEERLNLLVIED